MAAGKAYLHTDTDLVNSASKPVTLNFDGSATGITDISDMPQADNAYYSIGGVKTYSPKTYSIHKERPQGGGEISREN